MPEYATAYGLPEAPSAGDGLVAVREWLYNSKNPEWASQASNVVASFEQSDVARSEWLTTLQVMEDAGQLVQYIESVRSLDPVMKGKLLEFPLLQGLDAPTQFFEAVAMELHPREPLDSGVDVISAGAEGDTEMYFLQRGEVEVLIGTPARRIAVLGPGAYFGEAALMSNKPRNATVRTLSDGVELYALSEGGLVGTFQRFPVVGKALRARMQEAAQKADTTNDAENRLRIELQRWLAGKSLGSYAGAIVVSFQAADYTPQEWLPELKAMEKDGSLPEYARSVKKHYTPKGQRIESQFLNSAKKKLAKVPLLAKLLSASSDAKWKDSFLTELTEGLHRSSLPAGAIIVRKGDIGDAMYFLLQGTVRIFDSFDKPPLASLGPGDFFGETALVTQEPRNAHIQAQGPVEMFALDAAGLEKVLVKFPLVRKVLAAEAKRREADAAQKAKEADAKLAQLQRDKEDEDKLTQASGVGAPLGPGLITVVFTADGGRQLGLAFGADGTDGRPWIREVRPGTQASKFPELKPHLWLHKINGDVKPCEHFSVAMGTIRSATRPISLSFHASRDGGRAAAAATASPATSAEIKWMAGDVIDVDTEDGIEFGAIILGRADSGGKDQMRIKFYDGLVDDWPIEDFRVPVLPDAANDGAKDDILADLEQQLAELEKEEAAAKLPTMAKTVSVQVISARNLNKMDAFGKADPYVRLKLDDYSDTWQQTTVVKNSLSPVWN